MIPGEYLIKDGSLEINSESKTISIEIINEGDRPIQVGSHFHFAEVNAFLNLIEKKQKKDLILLQVHQLDLNQDKKIVDLVYYKGKNILDLITIIENEITMTKKLIKKHMLTCMDLQLEIE